MRNEVSHALSCMLVIVVSCALDISTQARGSTFTACVAQGTSGCPLGPSPASDTFVRNVNGSASADVSAFSTGGVLGGAASATATGTNGGSSAAIGASFGANAIIDDLIISGPGPLASVQVSVNLNGSVDLSGAISTSAFAKVTAFLQLKDPLGLDSPLASFSTSNLSSPSNTVVNTSLTTSAVSLPTATNLEIHLELEGETVVSDTFFDGAGSANAAVNFLNGISFPTTGPVFILPAGYTANSVSGNIVDNQFVPPIESADFDDDGDIDGFDFLKWQRGDTPGLGSAEEYALWESQFGNMVPLSALTVAVPEPSTLLLASLAGLVFGCRRR